MSKNIKTQAEETQDRQLRRLKTLYKVSDSSSAYIVKIGEQSYALPKGNAELFIRSLAQAGI